MRPLVQHAKSLGTVLFLWADRVRCEQLVELRAGSPVRPEGPAVDLRRLEGAMLLAPRGGGR